MATVPKQLIRIVDSRYEQATEALKAWVEKFNEDPHNALRWSQDTFKLAAQHMALKNLRDLLTSPEYNNTIANLVKSYEESVLNHAKYPQFSTSAASNLLNQYDAVAQATIVELLRSYVGKDAE